MARRSVLKKPEIRRRPEKRAAPANPTLSHVKERAPEVSQVKLPENRGSSPRSLAVDALRSAAKPVAIATGIGLGGLAIASVAPRVGRGVGEGLFETFAGLGAGVGGGLSNALGLPYGGGDAGGYGGQANGEGGGNGQGSGFASLILPIVLIGGIAFLVTRGSK